MNVLLHLLIYIFTSKKKLIDNNKCKATPLAEDISKLDLARIIKQTETDLKAYKERMKEIVAAEPSKKEQWEVYLELNITFMNQPPLYLRIKCGMTVAKLKKEISDHRFRGINKKDLKELRIYFGPGPDPVEGKGRDKLEIFNLDATTRILARAPGIWGGGKRGAMAVPINPFDDMPILATDSEVVQETLKSLTKAWRLIF